MELPLNLNCDAKIVSEMEPPTTSNIDVGFNRWFVATASIIDPISNPLGSN